MNDLTEQNILDLSPPRKKAGFGYVQSLFSFVRPFLQSDPQKDYNKVVNTTPGPTSLQAEHQKAFETLTPNQADAYREALRDAVLSNDLGKMAPFIGSLPPQQEQIFLDIWKKAEQENAALLGGGLKMMNEVAGSSLMSDALSQGAMRISNIAQTGPQIKIEGPKPFDLFKL